MMQRLLRWMGIGSIGLLVLIVVAVVAVYAVSQHRANRHFAITPKPLAIPTDSASIARGEHLVTAVAMCVECHGPHLEGSVMVDDPALGRVVARNLTRGTGGVGNILTDADLVRAIRHGVAPDGRPLAIMPAQDFINFSEPDLAAVVAYVKSLPAVDNALPETSIGPIGRALLVTGKLPLYPAERIDHSRTSPSPMEPAGTVEYGKYLARIACTGCHGPKLAGGRVATGDPSWPPAANLTVTGPMKSWSEENFITLLRSGRRPDSTPVNPAMPWKSAGRMTDQELHAVWLYLRSVPGQATATATTTGSLRIADLMRSGGTTVRIMQSAASRRLLRRELDLREAATLIEEE